MPALQSGFEQTMAVVADPVEQRPRGLLPGRALSFPRPSGPLRAQMHIGTLREVVLPEQSELLISAQRWINTSNYTCGAAESILGFG